MISVVVLVSGGGSNLRALLDATDEPGFPARVVAVGSDRDDAGGLEVADGYGIPTFSVSFTSFADRDAWGAALLAQIRQWRPDLVVLSGLMRLLPPRVVDALAPALINTHTAYLPEFPGPHAVRDALAAGATQTGASIIVVDNGVDTGPIIAQERVDVQPGDSEVHLHERIKRVERRLLIQAVNDIATGHIDLKELTHA